MVDEIVGRMSPPRKYWEPFLGGGAVFFSLDGFIIDRAYLSDLNRELMTTYHIVQTNLPDLVTVLKEHAKRHAEDPDYFYKVRDGSFFDVVEAQTNLYTAARMIYLNRTCFNGLYRVNKQGKFNVSKGSYKNPQICQRYILADARSSLIKNLSSLKVTDFRSMESAHGCKVGKGDVVFCDPPYHGVFTSYQPQGFTEEDHQCLASAAYLWRERGAHVIITNSDTEFTRALYADFDVLDRVEVRGRIACKASGRAPAGTLIAELKP